MLCCHSWSQAIVVGDVSRMISLCRPSNGWIIPQKRERVLNASDFILGHLRAPDKKTPETGGIVVGSGAAISQFPNMIRKHTQMIPQYIQEQPTISQCHLELTI